MVSGAVCVFTSVSKMKSDDMPLRPLRLLVDIARCRTPASRLMGPSGTRADSHRRDYAQGWLTDREGCPRGSAGSVRQPLEGVFEVILQIVEILEPGMNPKKHALFPGAGRAERKMESGDDQRFEAAPAPAHLEQPHPLDHRGHGGTLVG